jgi:hydantoinase/carbamoylase family amidase
MTEGRPRVDLDRMLRRLDEFAAVGRTDAGGVTRLAYSPAETEAFEHLRSLLPGAFAVEEDPVGNLYATPRPGAARSLYLGSHLDSVVNGGRLDGTLGVVVALEAMEALHEAGVEPALPPTLAVFRGEESARFGQHTVGSRAALGRLTVEAFAATDDNDVPLWHAMNRSGFHPENLSEPTLDRERVAGFLEVHIEQGRVLDEGSEALGLVTSVRAPVRHRVTVTGAYDHSGATPMDLRRDALAGAGAMLREVRRVATDAAAEGDLVATVGDVTAVDGAINKVCGEVRFPLDVRSVDVEYRDAVEERLRDAVGAVADEHDLGVEFAELDRSEPVTLSSAMLDRLERAAATLEAPHRTLPSGGGHDAMNFQLAGVPTGMAFVPSVDGVSHSPDEETDPEAVEAAAALLARVLADGDLEGLADADAAAGTEAGSAARDADARA